MKYKDSEVLSSLIDRIGKVTKGLVYASETDAPIEAFSSSSMKQPSAKELLSSLERTDDLTSESDDIESFFKRLTTAREWHTEKQRKDVRKFKALRRLLETELEDVRLIRIGKIRVDVYVIGKSVEGNIVGIKTFAVET